MAEGPSNQGMDPGRLSQIQQANAAGGTVQPEENLAQVVADKLVGFLKIFGLDAKGIEKAGLGSLDSTKGFLDGKINGAAASLTVKREGGIAARILGSKITRDDTGLYKSENESTKLIAANIEPAHQQDFQAMLGDSSGMGKYSVADVAGGPPTSSNAPNFGGGSIHLA